MSGLPKYHRDVYHGDFFSMHKDITGRFCVLSNSYPDSVYSGPFYSFSDAFHLVSDVNQSWRYFYGKQTRNKARQICAIS